MVRCDDWGKATFMLILLIVSISALVTSIIYAVNVAQEQDYIRDQQCASKGWGEYISGESAGCVGSDGVGRLLVNKYYDGWGGGIAGMLIISSVIATGISLIYFCSNFSCD